MKVSAVGRIQFSDVFSKTIALRDDAVIDCLINGLLFTIAQPWTAPVSVPGHSWSTFSFCLPVQSSLFAMKRIFHFAHSVQNAKGGVKNPCTWFDFQKPRVRALDRSDLLTVRVRSPLILFYTFVLRASKVPLFALCGRFSLYLSERNARRERWVRYARCVSFHGREPFRGLTCAEWVNILTWAHHYLHVLGCEWK